MSASGSSNDENAPIARLTSSFTPSIRPPSSDSATPTCWLLPFRRGQLLVQGDALGASIPAGASSNALTGSQFDNRPAGTRLQITRDEGVRPQLLRPMCSGIVRPLHSKHYLGRFEDLDCWAADLDAPDDENTAPGRAAGERPQTASRLHEGFEREHGLVPMALRPAMLQLPETQAELASRAAQLVEWDSSHRFCGRCATPTVRDVAERARRCPGCGLTQYPRHSPVAMALIWRDRELLLARSPHFAPGMYSALAGFVEAGESLEQCLRREVTEEVGVQVDQLRYFQSQSWPFPHSLMAAFTARWIGGEIVPEEGEIEDARWFPIDALPPIPHPYSIAGRLIRAAVAAVQAGRSPGDMGAPSAVSPVAGSAALPGAARPG